MNPEKISHSSFTDFHVAVLNENTVGFTHPNKIYGAMFEKTYFIYRPIKSYAGKF